MKMRESTQLTRIRQALLIINLPLYINNFYLQVCMTVNQSNTFAEFVLQSCSDCTTNSAYCIRTRLLSTTWPYLLLSNKSTAKAVIPAEIFGYIRGCIFKETRHQLPKNLVSSQRFGLRNSPLRYFLSFKEPTSLILISIATLFSLVACSSSGLYLHPSVHLQPQRLSV